METSGWDERLRTAIILVEVAKGRKNSENSGVDRQPRGTGPLHGQPCGSVDGFFFYVFLVLLSKHMSSWCNWYIFVGYLGIK